MNMQSHTLNVKDLHQSTGTIPQNELQRVLSQLIKKTSKLRHPIQQGKHIHLRVDLTNGLNDDAFEFLEEVKKSFDHFSIFLPFIKNMDFGYIREGALQIHPQSIARIKEIIDHTPIKMGLLADPFETFTKTLNSPSLLWPQIIAQLKQSDINISTVASSFQTNLESISNRIWLYRALGRLENLDIQKILKLLPLEGREWSNDVIDHLNLELSDPIEKISINHSSADYSLDEIMSPEFIVKNKNIIFSNEHGWSCIADGQHNRTSIEEVINLINSSSKNELHIIIDPSHFILSNNKPATDSILRELPHPYDHYLAINSDIDWSTYNFNKKSFAWLEKQTFNPYSTSAYTSTTDDRWVGWDKLDSNTDHSALLKSWIQSGYLDTLHGNAYTYDTIVLFNEPTQKNNKHSVAFKNTPNLSCYEGLLFEIESESLSIAGNLHIYFSDGSTQDIASYKTDQNNKNYLWFYFDSSSPISRLELTTETSVAIKKISTLQASAKKTTEILEKIKSYTAYFPAVFTHHGGGQGTRDFGSLVIDSAIEENPKEAHLSIDNPLSPYYVISKMKDLGTYFFNAVGQFSNAKLYRIKDLLFSRTAQDGKSYYFFTRFFSEAYLANQISPFWSYGKHGATAQGFAATVSDVLFQLKQSKDPSGAIIYTHLGHRLGNQLNEELGWNEECLQAFKNLNELSLPNDHYQLWLSSTSDILRYSAVSKNISKSISIEDDKISISAWDDPQIGKALPDHSRYGASWLHGITIYHQSPENIQLFIEKNEHKYFTLNTENNGQKSVSIVNDNNRINLLNKAANTTVLNESSNGWAISCKNKSSLQLRSSLKTLNSTHLTFKVTQFDMQSSLVFQAKDGEQVTLNLTELSDISFNKPITKNDIVTLPLSALSPEKRLVFNNIHSIHFQACEISELYLLAPQACQEILSSYDISGKVSIPWASSKMSSISISLASKNSQFSAEVNDLGYFTFQQLPKNQFYTFETNDYYSSYSRKIFLSEHINDLELIYREGSND